MTDNKLLKLAAKAAGFSPPLEVDVHAGLCFEYGDGFWNPLTDDGDALRLAVKLNILQKHAFFEALAHENDNCEGDYYIATRRAIVRAAAEIGRTK